MDEREILVDFFDFLKDVYGWHICINDFKQGRIESFLTKNKRFYEYIIHTHPKCMDVKSDRKRWDECIDGKKDMIKKSIEHNSSYFRYCHAGICEYILPIVIDDYLVAALSAGVLDKDPNKRAMDKKKMDQLFNVAKLLLEKVLKQHLDESKTERRIIDMDLYYVGNIIAYIRQNSSEEITLETLSGFCHISKSKISHIFKSYTGVNVKYYVNRIRIEKAKDLLLCSELSIRDVALEVGFKEPNYFSNCFKSVTGISPVVYRKKEIEKEALYE